MGKMTLILPALGIKRYAVDQRVNNISNETIKTFLPNAYSLLPIALRLIVALGYAKV